MKIIEKILTSNDVGETGSHQAGIAIPSDPVFVDFFPCLPEELNPSLQLRFLAPDGEEWDFRYVYYNNRYYGGTRNERRLCRTTRFLQSFRACAGDVLVLNQDAKGSYSASVRKPLPQSRPSRSQGDDFSSQKAQGLLRYRIVCKNGSWTLLSSPDQHP